MTRTFADRVDFTRWNEEMSRKYDSESYHLRSSFLIRWIEHRRVQAIVKLLESGRDDTVLEVGCGTGVVLSQMPAGHLWGLDLSSFVLQKSRRRLADRPTTLVQANAEQLPLAGRSFSRLLCTEVIEHVMNPRDLVRELARIASDDAIIVITAPNESLIDRLKALVGSLGLHRWLRRGRGWAEAYDSLAEEIEWHLHRFDRKMLEETLDGVLRIERLQASPFAFLPLRYVVRCRKLSTHS